MIKQFKKIGANHFPRLADIKSRYFSFGSSSVADELSHGEPDVKPNLRIDLQKSHTKLTQTNMLKNLLILHEIAYKASMVTSKRKFKEFESWLLEVVNSYKDAAIERYANIHLFKLREQFS